MHKLISPLTDRCPLLTVCPDQFGVSTTVLSIVSGFKYLAHNTYTLFIYSYLVHSSFTIIFPLHLLYLLVTTKHTAIPLLTGLRIAIANHLLPDQSVTTVKFPYYKFFRLAMIMTIGITIPALLWFAAVSLASLVVSPVHLRYINIIELSSQSKRCNRQVFWAKNKLSSEV